MDVISMRARRRFFQIGLAGLVICFAWLIQLTVLSLLPSRAVLCSFPMMITIVWGAVFGSSLQMPRADELRKVSLGQIVAMQALSGSLSGALVGAFFAALYASIIPVYPLCYPVVGWVAGYFCLRSFNQGSLLCVPLVLLLSVFAESVMAGQLAAIGRPNVLPHLVQVAVPEAIINAIISPFVFYPMRAWWEFSKAPSEVVRQ
jgi:rod shape-determining protein MreD